MYGIELFHFTEDDIDFNNKVILGEFWDVGKGHFVKKVTPFPHIVQDIRFQTAPEVRPKLMENGVLVMHVPLENKFKQDKILRESPMAEIKKYLIETFNYDEADPLELVNKYKEIIIKPLNAAFGKGVYKLSKLENEDTYRLHYEHEAKEISSEDFKKYDEIFRNKQYIVQEYVDSRTNKGHPFDIKAHLIRTVDGSWKNLGNLPRIGSELGVVSNTDTGGNTLGKSDRFLEEEFGENWLEVKQEMETLIDILPKALQLGYDRTLTTLGLDIGVNRKTRMPKLFEVNGTINPTRYRVETCQGLIALHKQFHKERLQAGEPMPQEFIVAGNNKLYFDCNGVEALKKENPQVKTFVILGETSKESVGHLVLSPEVEAIICCDNVPKDISAGIERCSSAKVIKTTSIEEASETLAKMINKQDKVMLQGSHPNGIEMVADKVLGTNLASLRRKRRNMNVNGFRIEVVDAFSGRIKKYHGSRRFLQIPDTMGDLSIREIGKEAFAAKEELRKVVLPPSAKKIASHAFLNCKSLQEAIILSNVKSIASNAFEGCLELTIIGENGSYAQTYAQGQNIKFLTTLQYKQLQFKKRVKRKLKRMMKK